MSARSKARKRAIDMIYLADLRETPLATVLGEESLRALDQPERMSSWEYAREAVQGVIEHSDRIDEQISTYAVGWTLARMPRVDRAILRLATWEILFNEEVPAAVAIAEAVESATVLSTDDSASFINGVLGSIAQAAR